MRACLRALSNCELCRHDKYHAGCTLVLRNAAVRRDAHRASICRRAETAGFGFLILWPEYPQIASGTLDGIF